MELLRGHSATPSSALAPYVRPAELFVSRRINAPQFDSRFWELFSSLQEISDTDFAVLDELFYVVEDFVPDVDAREPGDATVPELLAAARAFPNDCRANWPSRPGAYRRPGRFRWWCSTAVA